ncbi:MAG: hypothetical protein CVU36_16125 [Betaproteobacteria bacterium HGW-Betaproteobacteria-9]|nr:MAG: hypothetical protein CVU36_16125 [Betaproteobacteria bacterium HGW-Betaproteobacteria-9]
MALIAKDILGQAQAFVQSAGQAMLERALNWAYLSKAEGSFAIEGEAPSADKATMFAALLRSCPPSANRRGNSARRPGRATSTAATTGPRRQTPGSATWTSPRR